MLTNRNRIEFDGRIVRRYPIQDWDRARVRQVADQQEMARRAGLPVPAVLAVHADGPSPHIVMERAAGRPLVETPLSAAGQRRLGRELARIGATMRGLRDWPQADPTWSVLWRVLARVAPTAECRAAAEVAGQIEPTLVHGDLSWGNLLVTDEGDLVAILDWDGCSAADPAMDWAALCANCPPGVVDQMRRATPVAEELERRAAIYLATWPLQHRLWLAGDHPWLSGDRPLAEPRT